MDALRRAEQNETDASEGAPAAAEPDATDEAALSLAPLEQPAPAIKQPPAEAVPAPRQPVEDMAAPTATIHAATIGRGKQATNPWLIYGAGMVAIVLASAAYYGWKLSQLPPAARLAAAAPAPPIAAPVEEAPDAAELAPPTPPAPAPATAEPEQAIIKSPRSGLASAGDDAVERPAGVPQAAAIRIFKSRRSPPAASRLMQAYQAYRQGELTRASTLYRQVLARFPHNRDALLGLAAIALQGGDAAGAVSYYRTLLKLNPQDPVARVALLGLSDAEDPATTEGRLMRWLQTEPGNGPLNFALGNHYARRARWEQAQEAYFRAYGQDPSNADYAFNLGVSLDRLNKRALALKYYRLALDNAAGSAAGFDSATATARISALEHALEQRP